MWHGGRLTAPEWVPWGKPRFERLLLGLVAFATLSPVYARGTQDVTRLCLSHALLHGHLTIEPCAGSTIDHATYAGHVYSDKAPGFSLVAMPIVAVADLFATHGWEQGEWHVWFVRIATSGLALIALAFLVGRIAEGISPGYGAATLVAFALGTYVAPLAATTFDHVLAGAFAFAGFVLAWSRRYELAGLLVAMAVDTNYLCALIALVVAAYVAWAGPRPLARFAAGAAGPLLLLGAYDWAAFGSPFHISYSYVANHYSHQQASGVFGIHAPYAHAVQQVFVGGRGILVACPILVAAVGGIVLLAKRHRVEAIVCGAIFGALVLANCGYFLPYGGESPGPRFLVPSLPFIALGLAPAFARWFRTTVVLAAVSVVAMTALTLTWHQRVPAADRQTPWRAIERLLLGGEQSLRSHSPLAPTIFDWIGIGHAGAAALVCLAAGSAFVLALRRRSLPATPRPDLETASEPC